MTEKEECKNEKDCNEWKNVENSEQKIDISVNKMYNKFKQFGIWIYERVNACTSYFKKRGEVIWNKERLRR